MGQWYYMECIEVQNTHTDPYTSLSVVTGRWIVKPPTFYMWPKYLCSYKIKLLFWIADKLIVRMNVICSFIERMGSSLCARLTLRASRCVLLLLPWRILPCLPEWSPSVPCCYLYLLWFNPKQDLKRIQKQQSTWQ